MEKTYLKQMLLAIENDLTDSAIENSENEAKLIASFVLKVNKMELFFDRVLTKKQERQINKIVLLRKKHIPLQHIFKQVEFLNGKYYVNKNVLIPRFETEHLADIVVKDIKNNYTTPKVLDLCCGSGVLGISIAQNTTALVTLSDISTKALKVAKKNAKANKASVTLVKSDLFSSIAKGSIFDIIVSNPPYIKTGDLNGLDKEVKNYEPIIALNGGSDGLYFYKKIIEKSKDYLSENGTLYFEHGLGQENDIKQLLEHNGFNNIKVIKDFYNINRFIVGKKNLKS